MRYGRGLWRALKRCRAPRPHRYTKMGFAANSEPQYIIPTVIAIRESAKVGDKSTRRVAKGA